jgi:hypothetical protein
MLTDLVIAQASHSNPLASIAANCVVVRDSECRSHIIPLSHISGMRRIKTTCPALMVIASAFLLIAAAANCSRQGDGAALPMALLAAVFGIGYFLSRRASVAFVTDSYRAETCTGSLSEAAAVIGRVHAAQNAIN